MPAEMSISTSIIPVLEPVVLEQGDGGGKTQGLFDNVVIATAGTQSPSPSV
jgi:hypothetical protein